MHMIYFSCRISTEQQRVMLLGRSPSGPRKYFPIPVEHLEEEIRIRAADDGKLFREEFNVSLDFFLFCPVKMKGNIAQGKVHNTSLRSWVAVPPSQHGFLGGATQKL